MITNAAAAPVPVKLESGKIVIVTPLTSQDVMSVLRFGRQRELQAMLSAIPKDADEPTRRMMTQVAFEDSRNFDVNSSVFWSDAEVLQMVLHFALKHAHSDMTPEKAAKFAENPNDWNSLLSALNGEVQDPETEAETEKKTS